MRPTSLLLILASILQACSAGPTTSRTPAAQAQITCPQLLAQASENNEFEYRVQTFQNKEIELYHVNKEFSPDNKKNLLNKILLKDVWDDFDGKHEIVLGLNGAHLYLVADNFRVDGVIQGYVEAREIPGLAEKSDGFLFRLQNISDEQMQKIRDYLKNKQQHFSTSCIGYACKVLDQAGITVKGNPLTPTRKLKGMFTEGFIDKKGNPIKYEIYEIGNNHQNPQKNVNKFFMLQIVHGVLLSTIPQAIIYLIINGHF